VTLATGWRWEKLNDIADRGTFVDGDWVESKDQDPQGEVRLTQLADVGVAEFRDRSDRWMRTDQAERLRCTYLKPNDILIARMPEPLGRACMVPPSIGRAVTAVDVAILRIRREDIEPRYVMWALNAPQTHQQVVAQQSGTTRKRISRRNLGTVRLPIPPIGEQRRIVAILEDHLSRLESGDRALIDAARRTATMEMSVLSRVYAGLPLVKLAEAAEIQGGIQKQPKRQPKNNAYPFLRVANVTTSGLDLSEVHSIELFEGELQRLRLSVGDLLVVEGNGSPSQIGRAASWDGSIADCVHQNHLIRVRPKPGLLPNFLEAMWNSPQHRRQLTNVASSTSGLYTLSVSKLARLELPVPDLEDQEVALGQIDAIRIARLRLDAENARARRRAAQLRRATLAAAFSGQLTALRDGAALIEELASV
jgi:type I restriction enzyme, S subunit